MIACKLALRSNSLQQYYDRCVKFMEVLMFGRTLRRSFLLITIHFMLGLATETLTSSVTRRWDFYHQPKGIVFNCLLYYVVNSSIVFNCLYKPLKSRPMGSQGEVAVNSSVDVKSYTSLHTLVHDMFPPTTLVEQVSCDSCLLSRVVFCFRLRHRLRTYLNRWTPNRTIT